MAVPPSSRARTATVTVPRALLIVLSSMLLVTLLAVAFLIGRESGRAETAAPDLTVTTLPAPVEPAPARRVAPRPRPTPAPRPPADDSAPAPPVPPTSPPPPTPAALPVAPAEPAADPRERAAVARYFEEFDTIAGSDAGTGNPEAMAMALLNQATGGDWSQFDELANTQRLMLRQLRGLLVPPVCREYHQKIMGSSHECMQGE